MATDGIIWNAMHNRRSLYVLQPTNNIQRRTYVYFKAYALEEIRQKECILKGGQITYIPYAVLRKANKRRANRELNPIFSPILSTIKLEKSEEYAIIICT